MKRNKVIKAFALVPETGAWDGFMRPETYTLYKIKGLARRHMYQNGWENNANIVPVSIRILPPRRAAKSGLRKTTIHNIINTWTASQR